MPVRKVRRDVFHRPADAPGVLRALRVSLLVGLAFSGAACSHHAEAPSPAASPHPAPASPAPRAVSNSAPALANPITDTMPSVSAPEEGTPDSVGGQIARLRELLKAHPENTVARIHLAAALEKAGQASEAEDILRSGLQRGQKTPEMYHALGMLYLRSRLYPGAVEAFRFETQRAPKSALAHQSLALAWFYSERPNEALREYQTAQKLNPALPDTYLGLAFLNNSGDRYPYAVRYIQEYLKRGGQPGPGYALLCRVYLNMREPAKSIEAGKKAVELLPDSGSTWYNLGQAYAELPGTAQLPQAIAAFTRTTQLVANWGSAYFEWGRALERLGQIDEAVAKYREAIRCTPSQGTYHYQLGHLLMRQGKTQEGQNEVAQAQKQIPLNQKEEHLTALLRLSPDNPRHLLELSQVYAKLGETTKAQAYLTAATRQNPKDPAVLALLKQTQELLATTH